MSSLGRAGDEIGCTYLVGRAILNIGWILLGAVFGLGIGYGYAWVKAGDRIQEKVDIEVEVAITEATATLERDLRAEYGAKIEKWMTEKDCFRTGPGAPPSYVQIEAEKTKAGLPNPDLPPDYIPRR